MKKRIQFTALVKFDVEVELTDEQISILDNAGREFIVESDTEAGKILYDNLDYSKHGDCYFKYVGILDSE